MKRSCIVGIIIIALMIVLLPLSLKSASADASGKCGDNLYWSFNESTGILTITGSGSMDFLIAPWSQYKGSITEVVFPEGLTTIKSFAFQNCTKLKEITIPNTVTSIGLDAFDGCSGITSATIGEGVESISSTAFRNCTNLKKLTIPCSAWIAGNESFENCNSITELHLTKGNGKWRWYSDQIPWYYSRSTITTVTIDEDITLIGDGAFKNCTKLSAIIIPDSVTQIGESAFNGCTKLESAVLGDGLRTIGDSAFYKTGIRTIVIPEWIDKVGNYAFAYCPALITVVTPCSASINSTTFAGSYNIAIVKVTVGKGNWKIQGPWVSSGSNSVELVILDEGIEEIGSYAFSNCYCLESISIPQSVVRIKDYAFSLCSGLTSVSIPDNTRTIGAYAFSACTNLSSIEFGKGLNVIRKYAFSGCINLETIELPDHITYIDEGTFQECKGLKSISLNKIDYVYEKAFQECNSLGTVYFGKNLSYVKANAFDKCTGLKDVYYVGTKSNRDEKVTISSGNNPLKNAQWHYVPIDDAIEWNTSDVKFNGKTPYVIANGKAQTPRFTVKDANGKTVDASHYTYRYCENKNAGTGYVIITFKDEYTGTAQAWFKIYLPATNYMMVENRDDGIYMEWNPVEGAAGYVVYRRAWSTTTNGWTNFSRWNNTTDTFYTDGLDESHRVYAGTRYQYGVKAYFAQRVDPVSGATIGGNVGDNYNLGIVGPLKTTVRITTRVLNSVTGGSKQVTVKWATSKNFTGYEVQIATNAAFTKNVKTVKITNAKTAETTIKSLKAKTTYYARVRSYHEFEGMTYYGGWSNVLSAKTK